MPARYIPAVLIYVALFFGTVYFTNMESQFIADKELVQGTVVAFGDRSSMNTTVGSSTTKTATQALVDFDYNGQTYRAEGRGFGYPRWQLGETVGVYVSPSNPTESRLARTDEAFFFTLLCSIFLATCTLFTVINLIVYKVRGRPLS